MIPLTLGVRAHDFGKLPVETLADRIAAHGLSSVQLAPPKAIAGFDGQPGSLSGGFARYVRDVFAARGIRIAVLGCYINLGDRDEAVRRPQLERFKEHVRFARDFGCSVVGTETGSVLSDFSRHPDNAGEAAYQTVLASVRELAAEAEKFGVCVGIEGVERYVISTPRRLQRLVAEVGSPNVQVIYDPVNLLSADRAGEQEHWMREALQVLGSRIGIIHAKDFALVSGAFEERPAGEGALDYTPLFRWLKANKPGVDVLLENTDPATIARTVAYVRKAYAEA
jgi:sugar phosphate isomerase/epimerase